MRLAVLASGSGTILEAMLADGVAVVFVGADRPCRALDIATSASISSQLIARSSFKADFDRASYTDEVIRALDAHRIDLIAMAGFGTVLAPQFFERFGANVINTHPALLPSFKGWHGVRDALAYGVKVTGCTVHVATAEVDHGPILAQEPVRVEAGDTEETLHERIKKVERAIYVRTIKEIIERGSVL